MVPYLFRHRTHSSNYPTSAATVRHNRETTQAPKRVGLVIYRGGNQTVARSSHELKPIEQYFPLVEILLRDLLVKLGWNVNFETHFPILLSEGLYGLAQAYSRYDTSRGVKFETFAIKRIRGAMIDHMRFIFPMPRASREMQKQIDSATNELEQRLHRSPSQEELAESLGIPVEKLRAFIQRTEYFARISGSAQYSPDSNDGNGAENVAQSNPLEDLLRNETSSRVQRAVQQLDPREQLIIRRYYGEELTMKQISGILGVNESRVSQLHARALAKLKDALDGRLESLFLS